MSLPTLAQAKAYAAEPSTDKLLRDVFGCVDHEWGNGWLMCPDGVKRHSAFGSDGGPSAAEHYLSWDYDAHQIVTFFSIDGPRGEVLDVKRLVRPSRIELRWLVELYDAPKSYVSSSPRTTFNQVPVRSVATRGRVLAEVEAAHELAVHDALTNEDARQEWRDIFYSIKSIPTKSTYKAPEKITLPKQHKAPTRKDFAPAGFAPGTWFDWTDERDGVTYHCQVQSAGHRAGYVWVAGSHNDESSLTWLARLNHASSVKGKRDGTHATSLDILDGTGEQGIFGRTLATVDAQPAEELAVLFAA